MILARYRQSLASRPFAAAKQTAASQPSAPHPPRFTDRPFAAAKQTAAPQPPAPSPSSLADRPFAAASATSTGSAPFHSMRVSPTASCPRIDAAIGCAEIQWGLLSSYGESLRLLEGCQVSAAIGSAETEWGLLSSCGDSLRLRKGCQISAAPGSAETEWGLPSSYVEPFRLLRGCRYRTSCEKRPPWAWAPPEAVAARLHRASDQVRRRVTHRGASTAKRQWGKSSAHINATARDAIGVSIVSSGRRFRSFAGCQQLAHGAPVSSVPLCAGVFNQNRIEKVSLGHLSRMRQWTTKSRVGILNGSYKEG
jgi:hypothetical protein